MSKQFTCDDIDLIREQYPIVNMWSDDYYAYIAYVNLMEQYHSEPILEFLSTVNTDKTVEELKRRNLKGVVKALKTEDNNKVVVVFSNLNKSYLDEVNKYIDTFGWFPSVIKSKNVVYKYSEVNVLKVLSNIKLNDEVTVKYEAKYNKEVIVDEGFLYHVTPDIMWPKINHAGLTPKTQSKLANHPGRIYLLYKFKDKSSDIANTIQSLFDNYEHKKYVKYMYILKIDVSKLKNNKFFEDPNFKICDAVWTNENIPPYAISIYHKVLVNPDAE